MSNNTNTVSTKTTGSIIDTIAEARRQVEICNACRYCEGYCSVFPAITRERQFSDGNITQLANLCHNCRGCYYACQYTEPHEFSLNIPKVLAEVRQDSWEEHASPKFIAKTFQKSGLSIVLSIIVGFALLIWAISLFGSNGSGEGKGFYSVLPHNAMVALFAPTFLLPLLSVLISVKRYWKTIGGGIFTAKDFIGALKSAAQIKNLSGGHGDGCNFEDTDQFSNARRWTHQAVMYGFLLCFAATSIATILHYFFNMPAPYSFFSIPKLLGVSGGLLLSIGTLGMTYLKLKAERKLSDETVWSGEIGFIILLFLVSTTGLFLYIFSDSAWLTELLAIHLGTVLAFFLITPYSKMVHGFYRLAALIKDEQVMRLQTDNQI